MVVAHVAPRAVAEVPIDGLEPSSRDCREGGIDVHH